MSEKTVRSASEVDAIHELTEALRLTVEYIGTASLPPIEGWSWYDAMKKYAPDEANKLRTEYYSSKAPYPQPELRANEIFVTGMLAGRVSERAIVSEVNADERYFIISGDKFNYKISVEGMVK